MDTVNIWGSQQLVYMEMMIQKVFTGGESPISEEDFIKLVGLGYEATNGAALLSAQSGESYYDALHAEFFRLEKAGKKKKLGVVKKYTVDCDGNGMVQRIGLTLDSSMLIRPMMTDIFYIGIYEIMLFLSIATQIAVMSEHESYGDLVNRDSFQKDYLFHGREVCAYLHNGVANLFYSKVDDV